MKSMLLLCVLAVVPASAQETWFPEKGVRDLKTNIQQTVMELKAREQASKPVPAKESFDQDSSATASDIEVHYVERVEVIQNEVVVTIEGTVTNTAQSSANVRVGVSILHYRGKDSGGRTVYKLRGPTETQDYKNLQPGATRPLLARIVVISTTRVPNLRDLTWTAEVEISLNVR